jgi:hypothetical protein
MSWNPEAPHTHSQFKDRTGDEPVCNLDEHHWVGDDDAVCSRCGVTPEET